ncbi:DinB family protein, partial [Shewanella sp. C31]|nr:DinB family protein [Shewanella electrica]
MADYGSWEEALKRLGESRKALLALLRGADPGWLSRPLREGAWTPLMVAEHVALVEESTARVLRRLRRVAAGERPPPVQVQPGEFRDGKPQAPEGVRPKGGLSPEEVLALLEKARAFL